mgnify:CR=1 FL=1
MSRAPSMGPARTLRDFDWVLVALIVAQIRRRSWGWWGRSARMSASLLS